MKIKVVCNYNTDENIFNIVSDVWNIDKEYELTYGDDYTHLIIFNSYNRFNIKCDKKNVFGFIQEPSWGGFFDRNLPDYCNKVFYHKPDIFRQNNVIKHNSVMVHHLWNKPMKSEILYRKDNTKSIIESNFEKSKLLSIIVSNKSNEEQYKYRQKLIYDLLNSDIDFEMFGLGWNIKDKRFRGYVYNKIDALKNYKYSICLENSNEDGYITEKFTDAMLCKTVPIYNGSPNINKYYGDCCENIDLTSNNVIESIINILSSDKKYDLENAINLYINEYNPFKIIKNNL